MQARIRPALVALAFAAATFAGTAGTALMATSSPVIFGGGDNGMLLCEYTYDTTTLVMQQLIAVNSDTISHTINGSAYDPTTLVLLASRTVTLSPNSTDTFNIAPLNLKMQTLTGKGGVQYLGPPYLLACGMS